MTASWVTPATPSSAFGTSTPCQWIVTPVSTSWLRNVTSTRSPRRTRSSGPGLLPSNVSASIVRPDGIVIVPCLAVSVKRASGGPRCGPLRPSTLTPPLWCPAGTPPPSSCEPKSMTLYVLGKRLSHHIRPRARKPARASSAASAARTFSSVARMRIQGNPIPARSVSLGPMSTDGVVDVTILGAGPVGLSAAYYVGHRDGTVRIVESLEQIGGQVAATYPEKHVFDVAGFPKILGQKLVDMCAEQGLQYGADVRLGEEAKALERVNQNGEELLALTTDKGNTYLSRAMIITAGHGAFEPRRLGVEGIDEWLGRGLHYVVREKAQFAGKRCVIVGGGDSALDWTLGLRDTAGLPITLVHRRDRFRALESSMNEARRLEAEGAVRILTPHEVREVHGDGSIEAVTIENTSTGELERYDCEALITLLGFVSHLGAIAEWGLELEGKRQIRIDPMTCETSMRGVYAAGDVAGYPGKITLITVGMGEAAIAANNAIAAIRGEKVQPKYSTD